MKVTINGVELQLTPGQIAVIAAEINKPTKEERFAEIIKGIDINKPIIDFEEYPNTLFWFNGDKYMLQYNWETSDIWVRYNHVWEIFREEFNMEYSDIQIFIKGQVEEHFKLKGVTPMKKHFTTQLQVEEHFKLKGVTPGSILPQGFQW